MPGQRQIRASVAALKRHERAFVVYGLVMSAVQSVTPGWRSVGMCDVTVNRSARTAGARTQLRPVPQLDVDMNQATIPDALRADLQHHQQQLATKQIQEGSDGTVTTFGGALRGFPANAATTKQWATIGTSYPMKKTKSTLTTGSSSSSTFGIAVNSGSGWGASGTKTLEDSWGTRFTPSNNPRSYRVRVKYKMWYCRNSSGTTITRRKWMPIHETGGTQTYRLSSRPNFTHCEPVAASNWWRGRTRGSDYSLSYGVKFEDKIGIDLQTRRAYSSSSKLYYYLKQRRRLCGNNADPALAAKLRERL